MEYTKKIKFLVGHNIQLASPKRYIEELNKMLSFTKGVMEIKKKYTYEKNTRSKVLMIYAIISEADNVDKSLENIESERYLYVSFKRISSNNRLVAMQLNEIVNTKLRYETLFKAKLNDMVIKEGKKVKLEELLLKEKVNDSSLFIAVEQGVGQHTKDVYIVMNLRMKNKARL